MNNPEWWQVLAALVQAALAWAIYKATNRYANLTQELVKLQKDVVSLQEQREAPRTV